MIALCERRGLVHTHTHKASRMLMIACGMNYLNQMDTLEIYVYIYSVAFCCCVPQAVSLA